jgi:hypothetical protein
MRNRRCATRVLDHSYRDERSSLLVVGAAAEPRASYRSSRALLLDFRSALFPCFAAFDVSVIFLDLLGRIMGR